MDGGMMMRVADGAQAQIKSENALSFLTTYTGRH